MNKTEVAEKLFQMRSPTTRAVVNLLCAKADKFDGLFEKLAKATAQDVTVEFEGYKLTLGEVLNAIDSSYIANYDTFVGETAREIVADGPLNKIREVLYGLQSKLEEVEHDTRVMVEPIIQQRIGEDCNWVPSTGTC